ncbi:hypothetical protein AXG93_3242s1430 [Marchantia polymorpha subsp. ruderalis]|uniref:Uncharacterized protein n=1 Tax=Marchantia polymorpha subsp. ruderalis TaxID=1480154 RepID=A0A176WH07_MARPO|nr:hypothetical protein AXG93_3242s1430 [Marchantia polymorpha subsp. ruderalis]
MEKSFPHIFSWVMLHNATHSPHAHSPEELKPKDRCLAAAAAEDEDDDDHWPRTNNIFDSASGASSTPQPHLKGCQEQKAEGLKNLEICLFAWMREMQMAESNGEEFVNLRITCSELGIPFVFAQGDLSRVVF